MAHKYPSISAICQHCGATFAVSKPWNPNHFCSQECSAAARRKPLPALTCPACGASFVPTKKAQRYCSLPCFHRANTPSPSSPAEQIATTTAQSGDCLVWTGEVNNKGYGRMAIAGRRHPRLAHRVAWELANGPIPPGLEVCHKCDNPPCLRISHLFLGTHADNFADMVAKGRHYSRTRPELVPRGEKSGQTHLTADQVRDIRTRQAQGENMAALGREYGVTRQGIRAIVRGKAWGHIA